MQMGDGGTESSTHCTRFNHQVFSMTGMVRRLFQLMLNDVKRDEIYRSEQSLSRANDEFIIIESHLPKLMFIIGI